MARTPRCELRRCPGLQSFEALDADFREHYARNYANSGRNYEFYLAGYRSGYTLANDERFADKDWALVEPELRRFWEEYDAYEWDAFKDAIKFARDKARQRRISHKDPASKTGEGRSRPALVLTYMERSSSPLVVSKLCEPWATYYLPLPLLPLLPLLCLLAAVAFAVIAFISLVT